MFHLEALPAGDDCAVVRVTGEIDVYTAPQLREKVIELIASGRVHLMADLRHVEFMDSTGLGALVGALRRVRTQDGSLLLVTTSERILEIFDITGLTVAFSIYPSIPDAIAASPSWQEAVKNSNAIFS